MVTILIVGAILAMSLWVFKLYWRDICDWCAKAIRLASNVVKGVITFVKSGANVIAYLYRRMRSGGVEKMPIPAHPNCRCCIVPVVENRLTSIFKDDIMIGKSLGAAARNYPVKALDSK